MNLLGECDIGLALNELFVSQSLFCMIRLTCLITMHNKSTHRMSVETVHSVILAYNKSINYVMVLILNSQRPFLTTWYTFGKGCTLFATKLYRVVQFWLQKLYLVVLFISAGKKRGGPNFSTGDQFFQKILVPLDHFFLKYLVRGDCFWGDQLLRDRTLF